MRKPLIVITGDVINGLQFWGPFENADELYDWVYRAGLDDASWTSAELETPEGSKFAACLPTLERWTWVDSNPTYI